MLEGSFEEAVEMSTLHCPLCGLRFRFASELDEHARDHCAPQELHLPAHRERRRWGAPPPRSGQEERSSAIR